MKHIFFNYRHFFNFVQVTVLIQITETKYSELTKMSERNLKKVELAEKLGMKEFNKEQKNVNFRHLKL